ncbi:DUF305 domain-containing protein [Amycolatopsis sp. H20-H5]|uniref:DUF305 domain-containing protein n=1 Tax=Amycolatopsis sp. H20-H5 TaxID=3046309 RepID=UPI002DB877A2|nr:DUF305 domain-containing protein [Amycolatopsis sp. H20-H5]MEC3979302.1 DUF305 domain-containing protein [Amycolatopsis sp. H20-H5]
MIHRTMRFVLPVLAAGVLLAGCAGQSTGPAPSASASAAGHNQADVTFAQQMIPHHQQAVEMAKLVPAGTANQPIRDLASRIQQAQDPEIATMTGWLTAWGAPAPMAGMDHGSMAGMMSATEMADLAKAKGAEFDRRWLTMMTAHHQGAIDMAKAELGQGGSGEAKQLAQQIIDAQQREITTMNGLLSAG